VTYTVIGGGFGLYGYLPALIAGGNHVLLPVKYRERILGRTDLRQFDSYIMWVPTMEDGLSGAQSAIIATPPAAQAVLVRRIVNEFCNVKALFLEKPLAESPLSAAQLLNELEDNSISATVGFIFLRCPWVEKIAAATRSSGSINVIWHFQAHHFRHGTKTWKRIHEQGGGPLRFYGIHLIALLSSLGYSDVEESRLTKTNGNDITGWQASFAGKALPTCNVEVETLSNSNEFQVLVNSDAIINMSDPFDDIPRQGWQADSRVALLADLLNSEMPNDFRFLRDVTMLWERTENLFQ
jgi:predicted dehydrogenase